MNPRVRAYLAEGLIGAVIALVLYGLIWLCWTPDRWAVGGTAATASLLAGPVYRWLRRRTSL